MSKSRKTPRLIVMVGFDNAQILDITGPMQMFAAANDLFPEAPPYEVVLVAEKKTPLRTNGGLKLVPDRRFADFTPAEIKRIDTLLVAGGEGTREAMENTALLAFCAKAAKTARRAASICSGAFILAELGLLDGKRATTHWESLGRFEKRYPAIDVDKDAIYVRDGKTWTSAGVTTGIDMALAMIEEDCGHETALAIARRHVVYMIRPGGQSQFSAQLMAQSVPQGRLAALMQWIIDHPGEDLSVTALAARANMSERTFARSFTAETGVTPARFVMQVRLEHARQRLEQAKETVEQIAHQSGFSNPEHMRRAFQRFLNVSPQAYRERFRTPSHSATGAAS
ncbi:GlxA family transcriptional regulator [Tepidicaulis sp. LMO-SS28]|uniref:GlxA family transcriptional regulator n=1 Tax=Tepidicaulis sp. LMO-SS28 TaxID=3447455 RepID=UPI003EDF1F96